MSTVVERDESVLVERRTGMVAAHWNVNGQTQMAAVGFENDQAIATRRDSVVDDLVAHELGREDVKRREVAAAEHFGSTALKGNDVGRIRDLLDGVNPGKGFFVASLLARGEELSTLVS